MDAEHDYDVVIVGGGPAGSTTGAILRKYSDARVLILERETFPREHVGESQLPPISAILAEMGVWDEVEAAGFPIKVGATYRWGKVPELWDFDFVPGGQLEPEARPAKYAGQRTHTAFQVDRARYDDILLKHAQKLGCEVQQACGVNQVAVEAGQIRSLGLVDGQRVSARWYVDASGHAGVLRRAIGIETQCPARLKNVAVWDYWDDVAWNDTIGVGGTRVLVLSVPFGWIWFIPISATRASVGLVVGAEYYKTAGRRLEELYQAALRDDDRISVLLAKATQRGQVSTTKDWSFVADSAYLGNCLLAGEAIGFADPILSAGMTLAHSSARELGYTLKSLLAGQHDQRWLKEHYSKTQCDRVRQHIRFADFWYAANGQLSDLKQACARIAADSGFELTPESAWAWLAAGGFADDSPGQVGAAGVDLTAARRLTQQFTGGEVHWAVNEINRLDPALEGAVRVELPLYRAGEIRPTPALERGSKRVWIAGAVGIGLQLAHKVPHVVPLLEVMVRKIVEANPHSAPVARIHCAQALEYLLREGWLRGSLEAGHPRIELGDKQSGGTIGAHRPIKDGVRA